ncbi:DUF6508 domain-containing protein [Shewanella pneumatophori]|uniref:DUF6508 domain-containing protein n=1 Tax=Shewanella pneumatophori TaxID=314092 RepID=A0A9X1Z935_9GAMM|nr:DUF6508 domain-containing protein [Shewanella pneumatophori]MCL1137096.1 DUF6508 domain-containing protein [Shewanella pneumatophori]
MNNMTSNGYSNNLYAKYVADLKLGNHIVSDMRLQEFVADLEQCGMLLDEFDWDEWYQNSHMLDRPEYIGDASMYECQLLLTAMARIDRFSPGVLSNMRRQGVLLAIIERFQTLHFKQVS